MSNADTPDAIRPSKLHLDEDGTATIELTHGAAISTIVLRTKDVVPSVSTETVCCLAALLAMRADAVLQPGGPVSPAFLAGLRTVSDILSSWYPQLKPLRLDIENPGAPNEAPAGARVAAFFSGGVDSFYTLLKHQHQITDLIVVNGFDITNGNDRLWTEVSTMARSVGNALGKRVIEVHTDLRRTFNRTGLDWGEHLHGAAMGAIGHFVGADMHTIFIPATHTYRELFPWGSHPLLDPHWGTQRLSFHHDGCEATRVEKVRFIARHPIALEHLRVCFENRGGRYNCGQCEKCLRTMLNLAAVGALDRARTFPDRLDPDAVRALKLRGENVLSFARENLDALAQLPQAPQAEALRRALKTAIERATARARVVALFRRYPSAFRAAQRGKAFWIRTRSSWSNISTRPTGAR